MFGQILQDENGLFYDQVNCLHKVMATKFYILCFNNFKTRIKVEESIVPEDYKQGHFNHMKIIRMPRELLDFLKK